MNHPDFYCYVCAREAPAGTPGWERDSRHGAERCFCPKHRQQTRPALATFGDLIAHSQARSAR
jgi:hypothetical protein